MIATQPMLMFPLLFMLFLSLTRFSYLLLEGAMDSAAASCGSPLVLRHRTAARKLALAFTMPPGVDG